MIALFVVLTLVYINMIRNSRQYLNQKTADFIALNINDRTEILDLLQGYFNLNFSHYAKSPVKVYPARYHLCVNEHYVYGKLKQLKYDQKAPVRILCFEYIRLEDIVWAYTEPRGLEFPMVYVCTKDGKCFRGVGNDIILARIIGFLKGKYSLCKIGKEKLSIDQAFVSYSHEIESAFPDKTIMLNRFKAEASGGNIDMMYVSNPTDNNTNINNMNANDTNINTMNANNASIFNKNVDMMNLEEAKAYFMSAKFSQRELIDNQEKYKRYRANPEVTSAMEDKWKLEYMEDKLTNWDLIPDDKKSNIYYEFFIIINSTSNSASYIPRVIGLLDYAKIYDSNLILGMLYHFCALRGYASGYSLFCRNYDYSKDIYTKIKYLLDRVDRNDKRYDKYLENNEFNYEYINSSAYDDDLFNYRSKRLY